MKGKGFLRLLVSLLVVAAIGFVAIAGIGSDKTGSAQNVKLGLDLAGGVSITYETVKDDPTSEELSDTIYKMQLRAQSESTEAEVYQEGDRRITVAIPGANDADEVLEKLGKAGTIYFIYAYGPSDDSANVIQTGYDAEGKATFALTKTIEEIIANGNLVIDGSDIVNAQPQMYTDELQQTQYIVELNFSAAGTSKFSEASSYAYGYRNNSTDPMKNCIAIVYDNVVISCPGVAAVIDEGSATISGQESYEEAQRLASRIRIGALPLELSVLRYYVEGAQLGSNALDTSLLAGAIGLALIILFMICMYRIPGLASSIALLLYVGMMVLCLNIFDVTLTLPGIAGIILSIGMAVDANVIIFTRIQEEIGSGKTVRSSIKLGFSKALSAIIDGNVTTIIAAIVLAFLGSGTVIGFAKTLAIGIVLSMITALFITKFVLNSLVMMGADSVKCFGEKKASDKKISIVRKFGKFLIAPAIILVCGIVAIVINCSTIGEPFNYGLDFAGGTATTVTFEEGLPADIQSELGTKINSAIGQTPVISTVESSNMVTIKTKELSTEDRAKVSDILTGDYKIAEGMISTESVGAAVSGEMKKDALVAVIVAIICMLIYIWFRFKNINFAAASVIALIHDVAMVLVVYAVAKNWISVGNTFIACLLTILGYSINATIVTFDRIRENIKDKLDKESYIDIAEKSVKQTLTRSLYTSLTTLITIVLLAILGVSSVKEFALPLMAGIIAGTFSSICLATGIWYNLQKKFKKLV